MYRVNNKKFEKMVARGVDEIPEKFLKKLKNVAIIVEDEPSLSQRQTLKLRKNWTLFGLYEGVPQTERGSHYSSLPDKITIFKKPIEDSALDEDDIKEIVKETVWHEIAHHFGMDEAEVRARERQRRLQRKGGRDK